MINFSADVDGVEVLNRSFNRIEQRISDFRNIWPEVSGRIYGIFGKAFDTEGGSTAAGKFKPLTPAYAKRKAIKYPGQTILKATNSLFESMTNPDAPDAIFRPEKDQLTIGTKVPYGSAHQRGRGVPVRSFISFTERDKRDIQKGIQAGLVQFVRGLGFQVEEKAA